MSSQLQNHLKSVLGDTERKKWSFCQPMTSDSWQQRADRPATWRVLLGALTATPGHLKKAAPGSRGKNQTNKTHKESGSWFIFHRKHADQVCNATHLTVINCILSKSNLYV